MIKKYEGWIRLILMVTPMIAGYFDLKYTAREAVSKIDHLERDSDRRNEVINQLAIDVAVLKAWARQMTRDGKLPQP